MMLEDAKNWLNGDESVDPLAPHPKSGATALHVAAAKGYIKVMSILLQGELSLKKTAQFARSHLVHPKN